MIKVSAVAGFCIIVVLCLTSLLGMNNDNGNTDRIVDAIDNKKIEQPVVIVNNNNAETEDDKLQELYDKLDSIEEEMAREPEVVVVEKEVVKEVEVPVETTKTVSTTNTTSTGTSKTLVILDSDYVKVNGYKCEVCNQSGGEMEVWEDSNQHIHYSHNYRCTGALDSFYGPSVRGN